MKALRFLEPLIETYCKMATMPASPDNPWSVQKGDEIGTEIELQIIVYGLVLYKKPRVVVETGCYHGGLSEVLAAALKALDGRRLLYLTDTIKGHLDKAIERAKRHWPLTFPLTADANRLTLSIQDVLTESDLSIIDSSKESRVWELDYLKPGSIALVHDTQADANLGTLVKQRFPRHVHFETTKGATLIWV